MIRTLLLLLIGLITVGPLPALDDPYQQQLTELEAVVPREPTQAIAMAREILAQAGNPPEFQARLHALIADAHLQQGNFEAADTTAGEAIESLEGMISPSLHADLLGMRAALPWRQGNLTEALSIMLRAYRLVETDGEPAIIARTANRLGILYSHLGRPDEALEYYQTALRLDREHRTPPAKIASTLGNIGLLYHLLNDYPEAARYQSESIELFQQAEDPYGTARNQTNLAITRSKIEEPEAAISIINQSLATFIELKDPRGQASALLARATIYNTLGKPAQSLASLDEVIPLLTEQKADGEMAEALVIKARALLSLQRTDEALDYARQALTLADQVGMTNSLANAHQLLAAIHEARGDFSAALEAERAAATSQQEQLDARRHDLLAVLEVEFDTAERERALAELRASHAEQALSLQREQTRTRNAIGGIGLSIAALAGLFYGYRTKTRHARELQTANRRLAELNDEKTALMDIASHDLRGRLATIRWQAQARLHQSADELTPPLKNDFTNIAEAAGLMHHKVSRLLDSQRADSLQPLGAPETIDLPAWLRERTQSFTSAARAKSILLTQTGTASLTCATHPEELAIIVDNLLENALKFSPLNSEIILAIESIDGSPHLSITDSGPGIPLDEQPRLFEKFQKLSPRPTADETSTGLGLAIVKRLCDRLNLSIKVTSAHGKGTRFDLQFPS